MNKLLILLALGGVVLLNACQTLNGPAPVASQPNPPAASRIPSNASDRQTIPLATEPLSTKGEEMARLSVADLGKKLKINAEQITVVKITPTIWRDASLGCPKPGIDYIQVETAGYLISLEAGGKVYDYHTEEGKRVRLCETLKP